MRNICTGVHASSNVNVDTAKVVGCAILESMEGKLATDFSFKGKAITLDTRTTFKIENANRSSASFPEANSEGEIHNLAHTLYLYMHITGGLCVSLSPKWN